MAADDYRRALDRALREYEELAAERARLDERLGQLLQTIGTLSRLCGFVPTVPLGLTDACRLVLRSAGHPLTVTELRRQLEAMGLELSKYTNPLASIHVVVNRLVKAGEAEFLARAHEKPAYQWKPRVRAVAAGNHDEAMRMATTWLTQSGPPSTAGRVKGGKRKGGA